MILKREGKHQITAVSDYFSHRLLRLSFVTTCVQREDHKRFHVREKLDIIHLLFSVSFSDTFGWPSLSFAVYVMFNLPTICLTIARKGQEERTIAPLIWYWKTLH